MCFLHKRFFFFVAVIFSLSFYFYLKISKKKNFCVWLSVFLFFSFLIFKIYISVCSSCRFFFLFFSFFLKNFQKQILYLVVIVSFLFLKIKFQKKYIPFFPCGCRFFSLIFLFFNLKNLHSISVCGCRSLSFSFLFNYFFILCGCQGFWVGL